MARSLEEAEARIAVLERLVASVRHDVNGALTPALMVADRLRSSPHKEVQVAAEKIGASILRVTSITKATRDLVPPVKG